MQLNDSLIVVGVCLSLSQVSAQLVLPAAPRGAGRYKGWQADGSSRTVLGLVACAGLCPVLVYCSC